MAADGRIRRVGLLLLVLLLGAAGTGFAQRLPPSPNGVIVDEVPGQHRAFVPHHLPGTNTALKEFADKFGLPVDATRGGPETAYPEFQHRLRTDCNSHLR